MGGGGKMGCGRGIVEGFLWGGRMGLRWGDLRWVLVVVLVRGNGGMGWCIGFMGM